MSLQNHIRYYVLHWVTSSFSVQHILLLEWKISVFFFVEIWSSHGIHQHVFHHQQNVLYRYLRKDRQPQTLNSLVFLIAFQPLLVGDN